MWLVGTPITFSSTNVRQQLTTTVGLVKGIRFQHDPSNTHIVYFGNSTLDPTTTPKNGVLGWIPALTTTTLPPDFVYEYDAQNGIDSNLIWVAGQSGEVLLWSYIIQ